MYKKFFKKQNVFKFKQKKLKLSTSSKNNLFDNEN